jgi:hypothetical protein
MVFTVIGLCADILGAILLFAYGLPSKIKEVAGDFIVDGISDDEKEEILSHNKNIEIRAKLGLALLIGGFVFQLVGTFMQSL